jgi:quinoprotein glucose dehydrogenase
MVHHGVWDYDPPAAPILGDIRVGDRTIRAVTQLTKQGLLFVFDRLTGEPVWPIEEKPVPQSEVPGERLSPTQPFPTKPPPYSRLGFHEDDLIDFTPELRAEALAIATQYVRGPIYTPTTRVVEGGSQGTWVYPGYGGGANWNGGAFDPESGRLFVPTRNQPMVSALTTADPALTDWDYIRATTQTVRGPRGLPINRPPWSMITATDLNVGEHVWERAIGPAPEMVRDHPDLQGLGLDFSKMGYPGVRPSPLATRTLLFMGEAGNLAGDPGGPMFRAYDKATGAVLAEIELPAKASGAPMTYLHQGRQYIVVAVSTREHPAELVALALPEEGTEGTEERERSGGAPGRAAGSAGSEAAARAVDAPAPQRGATAAPSGTETELAAGRAGYARSCAVCHGERGEGIPGVSPSLGGLEDLEAIVRAVERGGIEMPPMNTLLTPQQIRAVSRYVLGLDAPRP